MRLTARPHWQYFRSCVFCSDDAKFLIDVKSWSSDEKKPIVKSTSMCKVHAEEYYRESLHAN